MAHDALDDSPDDGATGTRIAIGPAQLTPPFSPWIHDYYVRCANTDNRFSFSMIAPSGSTVALAEPITTPPAQYDSLDVTLRESQAIVVDVASGAVVDEYWIRCLPHDFPPIKMEQHFDAGTPPPGYYVLGNLYVLPGKRGYAAIIDVNGVPVWYGTGSTDIGVDDVESLAPGTVSYAGNPSSSTILDQGPFEIHDLKAGTTTFVRSSTKPTDHHELRLLPNGHYLIITTPVLPGVDLTGLPKYGPDAGVLGCDIQEVDGDGGVYWEWVATDHLDPVADSVWPETVTLDDASVVDVFHCNSIDVSDAGDLLVSARMLDSVFLVSRETGAIVWKLGGPAATGDGATYLAIKGDAGAFHGQHDARLVPGGVSMFDDQTGSSSPGRAVVYATDLDAGTASVVWQYAGPAAVPAMGSFRILPDGSRIIGWGGLGKEMAFTEVDDAGNDLLDFQFPAGTQSYRATKVPITAFDLETLRHAVGSD